jgi:transposase
MDYVPFHNSTATKNIIEAAGCFLVFLPTYSPDLNPIEHCWHTLQSKLRPMVESSYNSLSNNMHALVDDALNQLVSLGKS